MTIQLPLTGELHPLPWGVSAEACPPCARSSLRLWACKLASSPGGHDASWDTGPPPEQAESPAFSLLTFSPWVSFYYPGFDLHKKFTHHFVRIIKKGEITKNGKVTVLHKNLLIYVTLVLSADCKHTSRHAHRHTFTQSHVLNTLFSESFINTLWVPPMCWNTEGINSALSINLLYNLLSSISEMIGWHHWLSGHEFEQTQGDGEGQGSLVCCGPWSRQVGLDLETERQQII